MQFQDYYATLGVTRGASVEEIQRAYRALARKLHPDVNKEPGSAEKFARVQEAYEVLRDAEKRKLYDQLGANWKAGQDFRPPPGWEGGPAGGGRRGRGSGRGSARGPSPEDFANFAQGMGGFGSAGVGGVGGVGGAGGFSDFFDAIFGQMNQQQQQHGRRGGSARWEDAGAGGSSQRDAFAEGFRAAAEAPARGGNVSAVAHVSLEEAHRGATRTITVRDGQGERTIELKIPAGTSDGSSLRLAGQGQPSPGGAGDLLVTVKVDPHESFRFARAASTSDEGLAPDDLITDVVLTPWEAALGAKVDVRTLEGTVSISVPAGSSSGQRLRLRGRGLRRRGGGKGKATGSEASDLYVELKIAVPKTLSDDERRLMEQLAKVSSFRPRG